MGKNLYSFCSMLVLACVFFFSTSNQCKAQTFIGKLDSMWPNGQPLNSIDINDGSTITVIVINGWGGQKMAQGFIHFASGDETKTSLMNVDRYNNSTISATNNEYQNYAFENAIIFLEKKTISISVAGTSYMGTITEIR